MGGGGERGKYERRIGHAEHVPQKRIQRRMRKRKRGQSRTK